MTMQLSLFDAPALAIASQADARNHPTLYAETRAFLNLPDDAPLFATGLLGENCDAALAEKLIYAVADGRNWQVPILLNRFPTDTHEALLKKANEYTELNNQIRAIDMAAADWEAYRYLHSRLIEVHHSIPSPVGNWWREWSRRHWELKQAFWNHYGQEHDHFWLPTEPQATYGMLLPTGAYRRDFEEAYEDALAEVNPVNPWRVTFIEIPDWSAR